MMRTALLFSLSLVSLSLTACSSGDVPVGSTTQQQALKKTPSGGATGNGSTCSWDDTVSNSADGTTTTTPAPNGRYHVGDTFKSADNCNDCTCTGQGIACTLRDCAPAGGACPEDAKQCPDGSYVGRSGPTCEFAACPGGPIACPTLAKQCPDGSYVSPTGPSCAYPACPGGPVACPEDAKQCPDGSYVSRTGPDCSFPACP